VDAADSDVLEFEVVTVALVLVELSELALEEAVAFSVGVSAKKDPGSTQLVRKPAKKVKAKAFKEFFINMPQ
jgi:hypothetical protein